MSNNRITPFVKRMRTNGGTIYTFSSAVEDIGLNINERNNVVKISHFALLDIPSINEPTDIEENRFNVNAIAGTWEYAQNSASIKDGRVLIAESFQNYALNFESNLLNRDDYNATLTRTVTERVFWKWLKETGAIRFDKDVSVGSQQYWGEELDADGSLGYNRVVKYVGPVSAGNVRSDSFGTYNETYVLVPTSHGQTDAYFQIIEDDNYYHGMEIGDLGEKILGRESYTLPHPDGLSYNAYYDFVDSSTQVGSTPYYMYFDNSTGAYSPGWWYTSDGIEPTSTDNAYLTDSSIYITTGIYDTDLKYDDGGGSTIEFRRSKLDCLSLVTNLDDLKGIYSDPALTYDKMAIQYSINDAFNFNAVMIYYTVYNSTMDEVLGRNLLGVLFIDAPSGNSADIGFNGITIPSLEKIQSGPGGFGTSYSLRLNIKTDNMVDDTQATIVDMATSDQLYAEDWTEAFANLNTAVNILTQNNSTIQYISEQYVEVQATQTQILNDLQALQWQVNDIGRDIQGTANTVALFADGDDPLVDSSIYMKFGKVGIKEADPEYPLHISGTTKADEIIIENAIRDTSGNVLLGYGSPLQIGASTYDRDVDIYTGDLEPEVHINSSGITIKRDVSIGRNLFVDGSAWIQGLLAVEEIYSPNFDFGVSYIRDTSNGSTLSWVNGFLEASIGSSVSAEGSTGAIQFANNAGLLDADQSNLYYDSSTKRLAIGFNTPLYTLDVNGTFRSTNILSDTDFEIGKYTRIFIGGGLGSELGFELDNQHALLGDYEGLASGNYLDLDFTTGDSHFGLDGTGSLMVIESTGDVSIYGELSVVGLTEAQTLKNLWYNTTTGKITYGDPSGGGVGGGGDVYWDSGSVGSSNQIILSSGDGSINASTIQIISDDTIRSAYPGGLYLETGTGGSNTGDIAIYTGGSGTTSGDMFLETGSSSSGSGSITIRTGTGGGGSAGDVSIYAGATPGAATAGHVYINGGIQAGPPGTGGNVYINAGSGVSTDGRIYLGNVNTSGIYAGLASIPSGTAASNEFVFVDSGSSYQLKRHLGAIPVGAGGTGLTTAGTSYLLTGNGSSAFSAEANLRFSGTNLSLYSGSTENIRITNAGVGHFKNDVIAYSTTIPSDKRLKENINPLENSLDKILQLEGVSFERKSNGEKHIGFIAQDVEGIIPEVIVEKALPLETGEEDILYKTINYTEIIPHLVEGMKKQQEIIEELKSEIEKLKNK